MTEEGEGTIGEEIERWRIDEGEEERKERELGEVKGWDVGRPYVLGRSAGGGG